MATNKDGSSLAYFQRSDQYIDSNMSSTVFNSLRNSAMMHESSLEEFTNQLNQCGFLVQGYVGQTPACFGAIRIMTDSDWNVLDTYFSGGAGQEPLGKTGFGGVWQRTGMLGEIAYVWQNPAYSANNLGNQVVDLLMNAQRDFGHDSPQRGLYCVVPTNPVLSNDPVYDYARYILSGPINTSVEVLVTAATSSNPYHNVNATTSTIVRLTK